MRRKTVSGIMLTLLLAVTIGVTATPWDGVVDDPTPAQAIWVDPKNTTCFDVGDTFVVDVFINLTDPIGAGTGLWGFEYKLNWDSIVLEAESIQYHSPWLFDYVGKNETGSGLPEAPEGFDYHWLVIVGIAPSSAFVGVTSLCTYSFRVTSDGSCALNIYDDELVDDTATLIAHTTVDGYVTTVDACIIRADGSVFPSMAPISSVDNVTYTLTGNIEKPIIVERDNIVLDGAGYTLQGTGVWESIGINLTRRRNVTINNMKIKNFFDGIWLEYSSNNTICGNQVINNDNGVALTFESSNNTISGNNITANSFFGIGLWNCCDNNTISGNSITNNDRGIYLSFSSNNTICGNNIIDNDYSGIQVDSQYPYGVNNLIYHNNFENNTHQVWFMSDCLNFWDDGYPSGGNYWSDHNPPDIYGGPHQNETGSDKIGDIPYIINENNTDRYPLIYPYGYVPSPDANQDGIVDIEDLTITSLALWGTPGEPEWNPIADLNLDAIIDIVDLTIVTIHLWETV